MPRTERAALALLLAAAAASNAIASPCTGIDRSLDAARKTRLAPVIAAQLQVPPVDVLQSFRYRGWQIVLVDTHVTDAPYLFYAGDPSKAPPLAKWGGAAAIDEGPAIARWVRHETRGIPPKLASCFAFHVTRER